MDEFGWLIGWLPGWLIGQSLSALVGWSVGWLFCRLIGCLAGWLVGWSAVDPPVGQSVGWSVGLITHLVRQSKNYVPISTYGLYQDAHR